MASETSRVTVERPASGYSDAARSYAIVIDGTEVGKLKRGDRQMFTVAPGRHEIHARIDWARSPSLGVDLGPGEEVRLEVSPNSNPLTALYYMTFGRSKYLALRRLS